jgi:hypothetical protein
MVAMTKKAGTQHHMKPVPAPESPAATSVVNYE